MRRKNSGSARAERNNASKHNDMNDRSVEKATEQNRRKIAEALELLAKLKPELLNEAYPCMELANRCPNIYLDKPLMPDVAINHVLNVCALCKETRERQKPEQQ